jgi:Tol biopolymer transport system component
MRQITLMAGIGWLLLSCAEPTRPTTPPRLSILSGPIPADSVGRPVANPIRVKVERANGEAAAGVEVIYTTSYPVGPERTAFLYLDPIDRVAWTFAVPDTTDEAGRSVMRARRGYIAGPGLLRIDVPSLGLHDSIPFRILLDRPSGIAISPRDTALLVGGQMHLVGYLFDCCENADSAVSFSSDSPAVTVTADGRLVATQIGRAAIVAKGAGLSSTAFVSVVPSGTIAAWEVGNGLNSTMSSIVSFRTDGSDFRRLSTFPIANHEAVAPAWSPDGGSIVFQGNLHRLQVVSSSGGAARELMTANPAVDDEWWPQFSADGNWIYFVAANFNGSQQLWRVRSSGDNPARIGPPTPNAEWDTEPSPSPDGRSVVFATNRERVNDQRELSLAELDLATGAVRFLGSKGYGPRWSADGSKLAFVSALSTLADARALKIVNADLSGGRVITNSLLRVGAGISWSPDRDWIAVGGDFSYGSTPIVLVNTTTGLMLPLAFTRTMQQPAWKPATSGAGPSAAVHGAR